MWRWLYADSSRGGGGAWMLPRGADPSASRRHRTCAAAQAFAAFASASSPPGGAQSMARELGPGNISRPLV